MISKNGINRSTKRLNKTSILIKQRKIMIYYQTCRNKNLMAESNKQKKEESLKMMKKIKCIN